MPLTHYACTHCGGWILWFDTQEPLCCSNCMDVRNALPNEAFEYLHISEAKGTYTTKYRKHSEQFYEFWTEPQLGLGSHGWLILHPQGNIAYEAAPFYDAKALEFIKSLGGIQYLAASHPHGYGALWQLQEAFDPVLMIHKDDLQHTKAFKVTRPIDDHLELNDNFIFDRLGGHYDGQTSLYVKNQKLFFIGDALKIEFEDEKPSALSCHKGFHYSIPLTVEELKKYIEIFSRYDFDSVITPFELGHPITQEVAISLFTHLIKVGPHTQPVSIHTLKENYVRKSTTTI